MSANECSRCRDLRATVPIERPADLTKVLRVIRDNVSDGTLVETSHRAAVAPDRPSFEAIPLDGPWPDYIEHDFSCTTCGQAFRLRAETHHGAGGAWTPHP
jgi:hypothetical protein